jgi:hypothetical protein
MNIFSRIITGALLASTALASPALAIYPHIERQNPSKEAVNRLIQRSESVGVTFFNEDSGPGAAEACSDGAYGMANTDRQVLLCLGKHGDNWIEITDTMRHELVHVAQGCKGDGKQLLPLVEGKEQEYLDYADGVLGWPIALGYEPELWEIESEAFTLAHLLNSEEIGDLVVLYCGS